MLLSSLHHVISQHQQQISSLAEHQTVALRTLPTAQSCVTKGPEPLNQLIDSDPLEPTSCLVVNPKPFPPSSENWEGSLPFGDPDKHTNPQASNNFKTPIVQRNTNVFHAGMDFGIFSLILTLSKTSKRVVLNGKHQCLS